MASLSVHSFCGRLRDVAVATNSVAKFAKLANPTRIQHAGVPKRIPGSQFRFRRLNGNDFSTFCRNSVRFGLVTPEFTR